MWNVLRNLAEEQNKIIIFGCSALGAEIFKTLDFFKFSNDIYFFDNAKQHQGTIFCSKEVLSVKKLEEQLEDSLFILASKRFYEQMEAQLIDMGVSKEKILIPQEIDQVKLKKAEEIIEKRIPKKNLEFVVDLAEHCNLNCQNCDHFSPLAEEHFTDINIFERDIKRISEIMGDKVSCVDLEGGEPLLNEDVSKYIEIVHKYLPETQVQIFTNGILLEKMSQEFWETCHNHNVTLEITKYPIKFDYDKVKTLAEANKVNFRYFRGDVVVKTSMHKPLDLEGKQDKYRNFNACYMANGNCPMLKNGKLYGCTLTPNIDTFNKYFGKDIEVTKKDYIDIYDDISAEDVFEFLCNPTPVCRYCKVNEWTYDNEWKTTTRKIEEWT